MDADTGTLLADKGRIAAIELRDGFDSTGTGGSVLTSMSRLSFALAKAARRG